MSDLIYGNYNQEELDLEYDMQVFVEIGCHLDHMVDKLGLFSWHFPNDSRITIHVHSFFHILFIMRVVM